MIGWVRRTMRIAWCGIVLIAATLRGENPRHEMSLDSGWRTIAADTIAAEYDGFERPGFDDSGWSQVDAPHNWDDYGGAHRVVHGNRHGSAWYRRSFPLAAEERGRRVFLFFEGVGSYATVWVNGQLAGRHAGGRTTFTLDVTEFVHVGAENLLAVRADHPAGITDLPWVCGGCSSAPGFSEGSQPMGIFRPVTLVTTNDVRVEPFGVHVWNDADATASVATIHFTTELANYGVARTLTLRTRVLPRGPAPVKCHVIRDTSQGAEDTSAARESAAGVAEVSETVDLRAGANTVESVLRLENVTLWSLESPTLYTLETEVREGNRVIDRVETPFGIRTVHWPDPNAPESSPFLLNGKPVFINGTCEYEHLLGASHAFGDAQIYARVAQIRAAGFNAFRDAHQPHNLRYQEYWDRDGLLWWPQFAAQIWFDTPQFRQNFKALLRDWVRERRNSPSLVLWGLANESKLPPDFAAECVALIRELDPTSPSQRLVTTCNSGKGTDWNVPQNWSGTYGGKPEDYASDLLRQRLVGEYGAWRSLGLHSECGFVDKGVRSEDRAAALLETKIRLAESVRAHVPGHFHWLFATHDNPGRSIGSEGQQGADGWSELDRIGPANNKGLLTLWGEPTDLFYLYRANYAPPSTDPMVYIVSHTWPDRWNGPGRKSGIVVYSNCEEVELFNDVRHRSLGLRRRSVSVAKPVAKNASFSEANNEIGRTRGTNFAWDDVEIATNILYAEGRIGGKVVATDAIVLKNLPEAPHRSTLRSLKRDTLQTDLERGNEGNSKIDGRASVTVAAEGQNYLYRVNCGGPDYTDVNGQHWLADGGGKNWESISWANEYANVPPKFGSQRTSFEPIIGTVDEALFQTYRYGRHALRYRFAVPDGVYRVELYFMEPWYGAGGGDCTGWRLFDVAVNDTTVLRDVDLWKEAGFARAVKKVVSAKVAGGVLSISFPRVASYQAVISAIAISTADRAARAPEAIPSAVRRVRQASPTKGSSIEEAGQELSVSVARGERGKCTWKIQLGLGGAHDFRIRYSNPSDESKTGEMVVSTAEGSLVGRQTIQFTSTKAARSTTTAAAVFSMNAGDYVVSLDVSRDDAVRVEALVVK